MSNSRVACAVQRTVGAVFDAVAAEGRDEIAGELQLLATVFESWLKRIEMAGTSVIYLSGRLQNLNVFIILLAA